MGHILINFFFKFKYFLCLDLELEGGYTKKLGCFSPIRLSSLLFEDNVLNIRNLTENRYIDRLSLS